MTPAPGSRTLSAADIDLEQDFPRALFALVSDAYFTEDLLLKLNAIEVFARLGASA